MSGVRDVLLAGVAAAALLGTPELRAAQNSGAIGQIVPRGGVMALCGLPGATVSSVQVKPGDWLKAAMP